MRGSARSAAWSTLPIVALVLVAFPACQTRLIGSKTPSLQSKEFRLPRGAESGIPFHMSRPEFAIERTFNAKGEDQGYEVFVRYVTDPSTVYWINAQPAEFHENKLVAAFGFVDPWTNDGFAQGQLGGLQAVGADKSKGFIEAIGGFAASALGIHVLSKADTAGDFAGGSALLGFGAMGIKEGLISPADFAAQIETVKPLMAGKQTSTGTPLENLLERLRPDAPPATPFTVEEMVAFDAATEGELERAIDQYAVLTGVRLHVLLDAYRKEPLMGWPLIEAVNLHPPLDVVKTYELDALKKRIVSLIQIRAPLLPQNIAAFHKANVKARWEILRQLMYTDLLAATKGHSPEYDDAEELLYAAVGRHELWLEKHRLADFLGARELPLYGPNAPTPPAVGLVGEIKSARDRVTAIEAEVTLAVTTLVLSDDAASVERTSQVPTPVGPWAAQAFCDQHCRPRWAYYTGGRRQERAEWLERHLRANMHPDDLLPLTPKDRTVQDERGTPRPYVAQDGELVLLVEPSYPDREVRPPPELRGRCAPCGEVVLCPGGVR